MFNTLLDVVNSGVVDSPTSGSGQPSNYTGIDAETLIIVSITFVIGFLIGFGIRHLIQKFKDAPDNNPKSE